jgi:hypothetical protein
MLIGEVEGIVSRSPVSLRIGTAYYPAPFQCIGPMVVRKAGQCVGVLSAPKEGGKVLLFEVTALMIVVEDPTVERVVAGSHCTDGEARSDSAINILPYRLETQVILTP